MSESILTAIVHPVQFGNRFEIEGLLMETKIFAVAVPQIARLFPYFQDSQNQASQTLKRLMGKGFKTTKVKTEFNRNVTLACDLPDFERVLLKLYKLGDSVASALVEALIGVSLEQLFARAFGQKFEEEDFQEGLEQRFQHLKSFHPLYTSWLKSDANGDCSKVNWGTEVNALKTAAKLPLTPVNEYDRVQLKKLNEKEAIYNALRKVGLTHAIALSTL